MLAGSRDREAGPWSTVPASLSGWSPVLSLWLAPSQTPRGPLSLWECFSPSLAAASPHLGVCSNAPSSERSMGLVPIAQGRLGGGSQLSSHFCVETAAAVRGQLPMNASQGLRAGASGTHLGGDLDPCAHRGSPRGQISKVQVLYHRGWG